MKKQLFFIMFLVVLCSSVGFGFVYLEDKLSLIQTFPKEYTNYSEQGMYENAPWVNEYYPSDHYYDLFGNHIIDGYFVYGMDMNRNTSGTGGSNAYASQQYYKWFNGLIVVGDNLDDRGVLAIIGDNVRTFFTPNTFSQSLYNGMRFDFYLRQNYLTVLNSRISNPENGYTNLTPAEDWLTGINFSKILNEDTKFGGTFTNLHHEESRQFSNPFSGVDSDTSTIGTPTGLSVYGFNYRFKYLDTGISGEYARSEKYLDGTRADTPGNMFNINANRAMNDNLSVGGEFYRMDPTYETEFYCPGHPNGDTAASFYDPTGSIFLGYITGHYLYQLVEDNDDNDDYPENGRSRVSGFPGRAGDADGIIPKEYDRNKDAIYDYSQDFLSYDIDPPKTKLYIDRNNNLVPDSVEDDAYPDYSHVPAYYLPGETYCRFNKITGIYENQIASNVAVQKGLSGANLYSTFNLTPEVKCTLGILMDNSMEQTYQTLYSNATSSYVALGDEKAADLYGILRYEKDLERSGTITFSDMLMKVNDNIPNHTVRQIIDPLAMQVTYYIMPDQLPLRNSLLNRSVVEYSLSRNRGWNFCSRLNYEAGLHNEELKNYYPQRNTGYLTLLNKTKYIYSAPWPFLEGLFIIPEYKHVYETSNYSGNTAIVSPLDSIYNRNAFTNWLNLVNEYKLTPKTRLTAAYGVKKFDDLKSNLEDYYERNMTLQMIINDHYRGFSVFLTAGFVNYMYSFDNPGIMHNYENNPHGVLDNIEVNEFFVQVHCGF